jgi:hypothetical protein
MADTLPGSLPAPRGFPAPRVFPAPGADPTAGNPYASQAPKPAAELPWSPLAQAVGVTEPSTQDDALRQIQNAITRIATVDPKQAAELESRFSGAPKGGGFFGALKHLAGDILSPALSIGGKALDILGRTSHLVPALLEHGPVGFVHAITGEDKTSWGDILKDKGILQGHDLFSKIARGITGFVGDVATDPLTYLTLGAGAGVSAATRGALAGEEIAVAATKTAAVKAFAEKGGENFVRSALRSLSSQGDITQLIARRGNDLTERLMSIAGKDISETGRAILGDAADAWAQVYNKAQARTLGSWFAGNGGDIVLQSGRKLLPAEGKSIMEDLIRAGQFTKARGPAWEASKRAAAALGGMRARFAIPFTSFRFMSPFNVGAGVMERFGAGVLGRFFTGHAAGLAIDRAIRDGDMGAGDLATYLQQGWKGLRESAKIDEHLAEVIAAAKHRGPWFASPYFSASDVVGNFTKQFTSGKGMARIGLGGYLTKNAIDVARAQKERLGREALYTITTKEGQSQKDNIMRRLYSTFGYHPSARAEEKQLRKLGLAAADRDNTVSKYLSYFPESAPVGVDDIATGRLDEWFWSRPDTVAALARAGQDEGRQAEAHLAQQAILDDMKETARQVPEGSDRRRLLEEIRTLKNHGRDTVLRRDTHIGDVVHDWDDAGAITEGDVIKFTGPNPPISDFWLNVPTDMSAETIEAAGVKDLKLSHGDLGIVGVRGTSKRSARSLRVVTNARNIVTVDMRQGVKPESLGEVLNETAQHQAFLKAAGEARDQVKELIEDAHPLLATEHLAADAEHEAVANLATQAWKTRPGEAPEAFRFIFDDHQEIVVLDPRKLKVVSPEAAANVEGQGFFHRTIARSIRGRLTGSGVSATGKSIFDSAGQLRASYARQTRHMTLPEAEDFVRGELRKAGLAVKDSEPVFEHNLLTVLDDYQSYLGSALTSHLLGNSLARLEALGNLVPSEFGGFVKYDPVRIRLTKGLARALDRQSSKLQQVVARADRVLARASDTQEKAQAARAERTSRLLSHIEAGLNLDEIPESNLSRNAQRLLRNEVDLGEAVAAEKATLVDGRVLWQDRMIVTKTAVEKLKAAGLDDSTVERLLRDGEVYVSPQTGEVLTKKGIARKGGVRVYHPEFIQGEMAALDKRTAELDRIANEAFPVPRPPLRNSIPGAWQEDPNAELVPISTIDEHVETFPRGPGDLSPEGLHAGHSDEWWADTKASLEKDGLEKPVTLSKFEDKLILVDGNHRLAIAKSLGWTHIPAVGRETKVTSILETLTNAKGTETKWLKPSDIDPVFRQTPGRAVGTASREAARTTEKVAANFDEAVRRLEKQTSEDAMRVGRMRREVQSAFKERNRLQAESRGLVADIQPAVVLDAKSADHLGFLPVQAPGLSGIWVHPYIGEEMAWALGGKPISFLRQEWRKYALGPWKRWATYRNPGFHVRNTMGMWFMNILGGVTTADMESAHRVIMGHSNYKGYALKELTPVERARIGIDMVPGLRGKRVTYGDIADLTADMGIGRANSVAVRFADEVGSRVPVGKDAQRLRRPFQWVDRNLQNVGSTTEEWGRVSAWFAGMASSNGDLSAARAFVMMRHGDYADLTPAEDFIKDLVPFYKWMRTSLPFHVRMLAANPGAFLAMTDKAKSAVYTAEGFDRQQFEKYQPSWMHGRMYLPLPGSTAEASKYVLADLPYADVYRGFSDYLSSSLPIARNIIESFGIHQTVFTGRPLGTKLVPVASWLDFPGAHQLMAAMPYAQTGPDGRIYIPDTIDNVLGAFPAYARFRNWLSEDPARVDNRTKSLLSWFGLPFQKSTATMAEQDFYWSEIVPALEHMKSMGVELPTLAELHKAGQVTADAFTYPSFDEMFPTGVVGTS